MRVRNMGPTVKQKLDRNKNEGQAANRRFRKEIEAQSNQAPFARRLSQRLAYRYNSPSTCPCAARQVRVVERHREDQDQFL